MSSPRKAFFLQINRWLILAFIGSLGVLITTWVSQSLHEVERDRLNQRFQMEARGRADAVIGQLRQPLDHLATLQRLFGSVEHVDWAAFRKFVAPMLNQPGVRSYMWLPRVAAADRAAFEQEGKAVWDDDFSIISLDQDAQPVHAADRDQYFPMLYRVPEQGGRFLAGNDLYAVPARARLIDQAIDSSLPTATELGAITVGPPRSDSAFIIAPTYRGGVVPVTRAERRDKASGVVMVALNVADLFAAAAGSLPEIGVHVRLFDVNKPARNQIIALWSSRLHAAKRWFDETPLPYSEDMELASHVWTVQVEASPAWLEANRPAGLRFAFPFGLFVTALLLLYFHRLLGRSELADSLVVTHENDLKQRGAAETWANKLSMVVDQNPSTIFITDLDGRIEYVNEKFVETTGYSRAEAIGQNSSILRPLANDDPVYQGLREAIASAQSWKGELQNKRRDGTLYWERVLVSPIRDARGEVTNYMSIRENISELRAVMTRLQESEGRFRGAMAAMVEGLAILSPNGRFLFGNRAAEQLLQLAEGELQGMEPQDIPLERLREDGTPYLMDEFPSAITLREGREVRDAVVGYRAPDGQVTWVSLNTTPLLMGEAQNCGAVVTFTDITERRRADEQLKLAYAAIHHSGEGILVTDAAHRIVSANPAFESVTGYAAAEIIGKTPGYVSSAKHGDQFYATVQEVLDAAGYWQGEVWNQRKNGEVYPEWMGVSAVSENDGRPKYYVYIFSDMSERQAAQERIEFLAHHDPLTGLPNRLLLRDRAEQAQAQATRMQSRVALMFLDLDRFKTINDSLGHPVGDALLLTVVERLKGCVRDSDTISRQGGDEFIILLNDVRDSEAASRVADKIHQRMGEPIVLGNQTLISSFSIGIALYPDDGEDFDSLLQKADTAMYHAKESGRNSHRFFTEQMNLQVVEHMTMETQLRSALERNEFVLHYQPQLDLHEGGIVGVEALIRWNNPEFGLVSPAKFIPVAEDSGLIVPIGAWVLNEACRQAKAWQDAGLPPFVVAVNLSAVQFRRLDLVNTVINALVLSDLDSQWLELELTESILIQDAEATLDSVRRLKALGVKLSVDDFGTGYSSLAYLKRFSVDKLKIDQSFIRDLVADPDDAAIVRAIIQMARSLKLTTIAEGVETEELSNLLRLFHCDEIQGYWFARPIPADQLEAFVRAHKVP